MASSSNSPGRVSPVHSQAVYDETDESYFSPDNPADPFSGSIVLAPRSIPEYIERTLKPAGTIDIDLGKKVVRIKKVFAADAGRAEEPQNLSLNGVFEPRVEDEKGLIQLVEKVEAAVGPSRLEEATELSSQRPAIVLRNAIREEFSRRYHYDPIFDAKGVMDSSVDLEADIDKCQSTTHLTGVIRMVLSKENGEPLELSHPILYDATAEFDSVHHTIEYNIDFYTQAVQPQKKKKFCVIL